MRATVSLARRPKQCLTICSSTGVAVIGVFGDRGSFPRLAVAAAGQASTYPWCAMAGSVGDEGRRPRRGCAEIQPAPERPNNIGLLYRVSLPSDCVRLDEAAAGRRNTTHVPRVGRSRTRALPAAYPGQLRPPVSGHGTWCQYNISAESTRFLL